MRKKEYIKKKEYLDIYLSLMALFFLAPVFLTLVIAIKLDSLVSLFQAKTCGNPPEAF